MTNKINVVASRDRLALSFGDWRLKVGAEIGVERAAFSKVLCSKNKGLKLYCVDPWKTYEGYREHVPQERLDEFFEEAKARMAGYNCEFIRAFSSEAINYFSDNSLDFVYIDANHDYENAYHDITEWAKKVKVGGIVSGHDYVKAKGYGVIEALDDYTAANNVDKLFIFRGDKSPSWYFVK